MRLISLVPSWIAVAVGAVEVSLGAIQGITSEPTLGLQLLNSGLIITIGGALIASHIRFKDRSTEQAAKDRALAATMVQDAKDEAESEMHRMHDQNQKILAQIADSMKEMTVVLYGPRGRGGVLDDQDYTSEFRHQAIDHFTALELYVAQLSRLPGNPEWIQPKPIERKRRRSTDG